MGHVDACRMVSNVVTQGHRAGGRRSRCPNLCAPLSRRRVRWPWTACRSRSSTVDDESFTVGLIPHTVANTTLRS